MGFRVYEFVVQQMAIMGYLGRLLVIEEIVNPEMPVIGWFATAENIRNGSEYMKLKRAWLDSSSAFA